MGADTFEAHATGRTPAEAYANACAEARDRNGHRDGYSGDIQTTSGFVIVPLSLDADANVLYAAVNAILANDRNQYRIAKWERAGCIEIRDDKLKPGEHLYLFFGWGAC
jgi:hypothetical protein